MSRNNGNLTYSWSDRLEDLAAQLFALEPLTDPFARECVVVFGRVTGSWLRHYFVYEHARRREAKRRVLANLDVQPLFVFINDWLHRMAPDADLHRDPRFHPYSVESLQWRIYDRLQSGNLSGSAYDDLTSYLGPAPDARRTFRLAGELARLLDEYVVYRPDLICAWQDNQVATAVPTWQPALWRSLIDEDPDSYLSQFLQMDAGGLANCGIQNAYERVTVFAVPSMPPVYLHFFARLAAELPVHLLLFNPCLDHWQGDLTPRQVERLAIHDLGQQAVNEDELYLEVGNPLLSSFGVLTREFTGEVIARDDFIEADLAASEPPPDDTVLHALQNALRTRRDPIVPESRSESLQIHICHSPAREVDVLCDQLYAAFAAIPDLRPRDIQIQVSDLATYIPYLDAALSKRNRQAPEAIPYAVADRAQLRTSLVAVAFLKLLQLPESRFKANEVMDLLDCEAIQTAFDLDGQQLADLRSWIRDAGITWGQDAEHRQQIVGVPYAETSWQQGLDRMLLGYALGDEAGEIDEQTLVAAGPLNQLLPFTEIEGAGAEALGRLTRFYRDLVQWSQRLNTDHPADQWADILTELIDRFFVSSPATYRDIAALRRAVHHLARLTAVADLDGDLPLAVVTDFLKDEIERADAADSLTADAMVISGLRAGSSTPRRIIGLLGMNDGSFPRADDRPAFDLLRDEHRPCDPSIRLADRNAFLEALLSARDRLFISYLGRSERGNDELPPSSLVAELTDYLEQTGLSQRDPQTGLLDCEVLHRLQAFHPAYFATDHPDDPDNRLLSYSAANYAASQTLAPATDDSPDPAPVTPPPAAPDAEPMSLTAWCAFFVNPAKNYYRQTLQVNFDHATRALVADSEPFKLAGLEKYSVNQQILAECLASGDVTRLQAPLQQQGRIPLGQTGLATLEEHAEEITKVLDKPIRNAPSLADTTARQLLAAPRTTRPLTVSLAHTEINGQAEFITWDGRTMQLASRYTTIKAKDRLRAWLRHLLFCVQDDDIYTLCVGEECGVNKRSKKFDTQDPLVLTPIPSAEARELLLGYEVLLQRGRTEILPFAPETSLAYLLADGNREHAAEAKWSYGYSYSDNDDPYFIRAFGPDGPMQTDGFVDVAEAVCQPLIRHWAESPNGAGAD